jgi:transposase InsO family protein
VHELRPDLKRHLLREALRDLKGLYDERDRVRRAIRRHRLEVHCRDVLWSADETLLGRDLLGAEVRGLVLRDPASRRTLALAAGGPATARDVIAMLRRTALERGGWPLVFSSDNGPCFVAAEVEAFLEARGIVHLRNVPRTPEHNTWAEKAIGEIKAESGLRRGEFFPGAAREALEVVQAARRRLDERRPRRCLGWRTPVAVDEALPAAYTRVSRTLFYEAALGAVRRAVDGIDGTRARRRAEREAIFRTLHFFGLVTRYRGGLVIPLENAEVFS